MVMAGLLLAVALQAGTVQQGSSLQCALANAAGDSIAFVASAEGNDGLRLVPGSGSTWPVRGIMGARAVRVQPESFARSAFAFGTARNGLFFHLGDAHEGQNWRVATLYARDGSSAGMPLAYGFCRQEDAGAPAAAPGPIAAADGPIETGSFDSARWRDGDCALVTLAEHRAQFHYTVRNEAAVEFASEDTGIWNGVPVAVQHRVVRGLEGRSPGAAMLSSASGLDGLEMIFAQFDPARMVQLLQFSRLGGSGPMAAQPAFAICGRSFPVRRRSN